jgi:hypothetical protein
VPSAVTGGRRNAGDAGNQVRTGSSEPRPRQDGAADVAVGHGADQMAIRRRPAPALGCASIAAITSRSATIGRDEGAMS